MVYCNSFTSWHPKYKYEAIYQFSTQHSYASIHDALYNISGDELLRHLNISQPTVQLPISFEAIDYEQDVDETTEEKLSVWENFKKYIKHIYNKLIRML